MKSDRRRAAAKPPLRRSATDWQKLLDSTGEGIYGIDAQGRCTFVNRAACEMLGYAPQELLGRNMHELIHHTRSDGTPYPEMECPIFRALRAGQGTRSADDVLFRKDGSSFPAEYASSPIVSRGELSGAIVTFLDINTRRKAEQRLQMQFRLSQLLASARRLDEVARSLLETIGKFLRWEMGFLWLRDAGESSLHCVGTWHTPGLWAVHLEEATCSRQFTRGAGLPGRVWEQQTVVWLQDLAAEVNLPRIRELTDEKLKSGIAFPLTDRGVVVGVIEFFTRDLRQADSDLVETLLSVGRQIGQFIQRARGEEALRSSENRKT